MHRLIHSTVILLIAALVAGCEFRCSLGGPLEPEVVGPLTSEPQEFPDDDDVGVVHSDTAIYWVAWAHPDGAQGDVVTARLVAVDVGGVVAPGTVVLEVPRTLESDQNAGYFSFTKPDRGWPPGRYRVTIERAGQSVGAVEFGVAPSEGTGG